MENELNSLNCKFQKTVHMIQRGIELESFSNLETSQSNINKLTKDVQNGLNIILKIQALRSNIAVSRHDELLHSCKEKFEQIEMLKSHLNTLQSNLDKKKEILLAKATPKNRNKPSISLQQLDEIENDLEEGLLLKEAKQNLLITSKNLGDTTIGLKNQQDQLETINRDLNEGQYSIYKSNRLLGEISEKKFWTKLLLHSIVILLMICIISVMVIKFLKTRK